jgi:D-glycero-D-manno-heptose 1,7-bisphosphate phosphatase
MHELRCSAVLFDRDGTLVEDVPYNADPDLVAPIAGAREALDRLRTTGLAVGVVTNQSGVARGLISRAELDRVNERIEELLGPFDIWRVCLHSPADGCDCRKPRPGLVLDAAGALGVEPARCVVVGDIGADVEAARAAGARAVLVPTSVTRSDEVAAAPRTAPDLRRAVDWILGGAP